MKKKEKISKVMKVDMTSPKSKSCPGRAVPAPRPRAKGTKSAK